MWEVPLKCAQSIAADVPGARVKSQAVLTWGYKMVRVTTPLSCPMITPTFDRIYSTSLPLTASSLAGQQSSGVSLLGGCHVIPTIDGEPPSRVQELGDNLLSGGLCLEVPGILPIALHIALGNT